MKFVKNGNDVFAKGDQAGNPMISSIMYNFGHLLPEKEEISARQLANMIKENYSLGNTSNDIYHQFLLNLG